MKVTTDACILGAWANLKNAKQILDIGTGTGLLALMAAQRSRAEIDAIEIDADAATQAKENMRASKFNQRIRVLNKDVRKFLPRRKYDHIICNPPFYSGSLRSSDTKKNKAKHSTELTIPELMTAIVRLSTKDARVSLLFPGNRDSLPVFESMLINGFIAERFRGIRDNPGKKYIHSALLEFKRGLAKPEPVDMLLINDSSGKWSADYKNLMRDFYLDVEAK